MNRDEAWSYLNSLQYIPCRDQFYLPNTRKDWVVMHEMVSPERSDMAEALGNYFRNPERLASTHFGADDNSVARYANFYWKVIGAAGANERGWHIEQAGSGVQTETEWQDPFSQRMIREQSSKVCAALCVIDSIPIQFVDANGLIRGVRGITTHLETCKAFLANNLSQWHYDPKNFPMQQFLQYVARHAGQPLEGDDDMPRYKDWSTEDKAALQSDLGQTIDAKISGLKTDLGKWMVDQRMLAGPVAFKAADKPDQFLVYLGDSGLLRYHIRNPNEYRLLAMDDELRDALQTVELRTADDIAWLNGIPLVNPA